MNERNIKLGQWQKSYTVSLSANVFVCNLFIVGWLWSPKAKLTIPTKKSEPELADSCPIRTAADLKTIHKYEVQLVATPAGVNIP